MARGLMVYPMGGTIDGRAGDHVLLAPPVHRRQRDRRARRGIVERAAAIAAAASCGKPRVTQSSDLSPYLACKHQPGGAPPCMTDSASEADRCSAPPQRADASPPAQRSPCPRSRWRSRSSSPSAPAASRASTTRSAARSAVWSTRTAPSTGLRCSVESTGGSVYNVNTIKAGELDFGMAQSDVQYQAYNGTGPFKEADTDLRAVFSVHPEPFTVVARKEANIKTFADFKGKRFNVGNPGSGTRSAMEELLTADEHEDQRLRARLRAQGRRARPGAVRQQDRRVLLRRRPPLGQHPGSDHRLRREAGLAHRARDRRAGEEVSVLRLRDDPRRHVREQPASRPRPTACWRRW